ncbi:MAG: hypothetical protein ACRC7S_17290 [Cetobacterium sp.]
MLPYTNITLDLVRIELGKTGPISLNDSDVRQLAQIPFGPISLGDLRGKQLEEEEEVVLMVHKTARVDTEANASPLVSYQYYEIGG